MEGRKLSLGVKGRENDKEVVKAWHRLFANGSPVPPHGPSTAVSALEPEPDGVTVGEVLTAFLADCKGRIKPKCLHDYSAQAESYARKPTCSASTQHDFLANPRSCVQVGGTGTAH